MANCNDCICSEVCYYKAFNDERILKKRRDDVEKNCKSFLHRDSLKNAHTVDAVAVVRCRDCKFGDWDSEPDDAMVCMRTKDGFWRSGNDFCSYGKRKDGDGNG